MSARKRAYTTERLIEKYNELQEAVDSTSGPTNAAKNSHTGYLIESGKVTDAQLRVKFNEFRYEVYLRGKGVDGNPPDSQCAMLEPIDPNQDKKMKVVAQFQKWPGSNGGWQNQF
jgi:hypothetical protein